MAYDLQKKSLIATQKNGRELENHIKGVLENINIVCHLEYKSFKRTKTSKGNDNNNNNNNNDCTTCDSEFYGEGWQACETPRGIKTKGNKDKGVFVEYSFPDGGNELEINYTITYNVKEMCKNTGKNYIRIHFTINFGEDGVQEVAIPMLWDTHGKPKKEEAVIRVKQIVAEFSKPSNLFFYKCSSNGDGLSKFPMNAIDPNVEPIFISRKD